MTKWESFKNTMLTVSALAIAPIFVIFMLGMVGLGVIAGLILLWEMAFK